MKFTKLVPNIFYTDIKVGIRLFIECLEFRIGHDELNSDHPFCAIEKVASTHPEFLHPNLKQITLRPWGAKEFALKDDSNVCIIIQQW